MRLTHPPMIAILIGLLPLVGCASPGEPAGRDAAGDGTRSPVGTVWRWTSFAGDPAIDVDQPGRYTLELLDDGRYAIRADCNTGGGDYTIADTALSLGPGALTMAACGPDSLADRFVSLVARAAAFDCRGERLELILGKDGGSMIFEAARPVALAGSSWLVHGYNNGKQGVSSVAVGTTLHATFGEDGTLSGSAGCNSFHASYEVDGETLSVGPAASTRKMCQGDGVMEQESAFLAALATATTWGIRGERLQLRTVEGSLAVSLVSAVSGTVTYRTRQALPPNARILVQLQDVSLADAPAVLLGEQALGTGGRQVPFAFEIPFEPASIDPRHSYGLRATITMDDKLLFTSTRAYPVITRDAPRYDIEIVVEPVRPGE